MQRGLGLKAALPSSLSELDLTEGRSPFGGSSWRFEKAQAFPRNCYANGTVKVGDIPLL
jgi:hypothetical protein